MTQIEPLRVGTPETHRVTFHGQGGTLFGIFVVNALLMVLTLGVYYFWGKVKTRQYFFGQTEIGDDRLGYHGTGKELFLGWLKLMVCISALSACLAILAKLLGKAAPLAMLAFYGLVLALIPYAMVAAQRYMLSRTSWRGIRFSFRGEAKNFISTFIKGALLTGLTLGLYSPYLMNTIQTFFINNSYYGSRRFEYDGQGRDLFWPFVKALLLSIPTFGICLLWFHAHRQRYIWEHVRIGDLRFRSTVTGGGLLGLLFTNALLVMFTLGLGAPWARVRSARFHCENLILEGPLAFADVKQERRISGAMGEELADVLDIGAGVGLGM